MAKIIISFAVLCLLLCLGQTLSNIELFLLPDQTLFDYGINRNSDLGRCYIQNTSAFCSFYGKYLFPNGTSTGLPDLYGTGCLGEGCWGPPNTYLNYQNTLLEICSGDVVKDGANMLRIGILKGYCGTICPTTTSEGSGGVTPGKPTVLDMLYREYSTRPQLKF